jgi:fructose-1,6-bisphosphatase II / sedoheptulose-1,7-bisphosphatase
MKKIKLELSKWVLIDFDKKYELNEIVSGDSIFCATGITSGDLVKGILVNDNSYVSETLITHKSSNLKKFYKSTNKI